MGVLGLVFLATFDRNLEGSAAKSDSWRGGEGRLWALAVKGNYRKIYGFSLKIKIFQYNHEILSILDGHGW